MEGFIKYEDLKNDINNKSPTYNPQKTPGKPYRVGWNLARVQL